MWHKNVEKLKQEGEVMIKSIFVKTEPWLSHLEEMNEICNLLHLENASDRYGVQMKGFYRMELSFERINELLEEYKMLLEQDIKDVKSAAVQMELFDKVIADNISKES